MSKILISNGRVIDPSTGRDEVTDVLVVDQNIDAIGPIEPDSETNVIDAKGKLVIPGVIDLHVHLRDMEQDYKETIITGTKAARKGGVTSVLTSRTPNPRRAAKETIRKTKK